MMEQGVRSIRKQFMISRLSQKKSKRKSNAGFSLIEVLVALLLVVIVMLALMEAVVLHIQTNMRNILRDEAVKVTQDALHEIRSREFDRVVAGETSFTVGKSIRSADWNYEVTVNISDWPNPPTPPRTKSIQVTTEWEYLGKDFSHAANSMMSR